MDDDFEGESEGGDDDDSLSVGALVIVTVDDGYETGVLLGTGEAGVRLRVTHRTVRTEPSLTEKEKLAAEAAIKGLSRRDLIEYGWEVIGARAVVSKRERLEEVCLEDFCDTELAKRKGYDSLKPLTRPVSTFIPWTTISKIVSFSEWNEEQTLRPYEASMAEPTKD